MSDTTRVQITLRDVIFAEPLWVDTITGAIHESPPDRIVAEGNKIVLRDIPLHDAPVFITDKSVVRTASE